MLLRKRTNKLWGFGTLAHKAFKIEGQLQSYLLFYLVLDLSPEQIAGTLQLRHQISLSYQSIYRYLQRDNWWGGELFKQLRKVGKRYSYLGDQKRRRKFSQMPVVNRVSIRERPPEVEHRRRLGDWEIDTIVGREHKSALLSITERKSQFLCLRKLNGKTSDAVKGVFLGIRANARNLGTAEQLLQVVIIPTRFQALIFHAQFCGPILF
jgi:IS30 family transposase